MIASFLEAWIAFQKRNRLLCASLLLGFFGLAISIAEKGEIQAFPEFTNVQIQVISQYPGKAAEEIERSVTMPVEVATNGIPGLINQRSISIFGLSVVTLTFDDNVVSRQARLDVTQHLSDASVPDGVKPSLSPDSTPVGEIYRYTLSGSAPLDEQRLVEDWTLEREFKSIAGVADVVSFGGPVRTVEVKLDLPKLKALGLSAATIAQTLGQNNANAGGSIITHGEENFVVRSIGLYENPEDLESAVILTQKNIPLRIRDLGNVQIGHRQRLGQVGRNGNDDVVEGLILLRAGADTLTTCREIREKIEKLNTSILPKTLHIDSLYDRTELIARSSHTVFHNIIFGILLVGLLLGLAFGYQNWPLTAAVSLIIPFALLLTFLGLRLCGYPPNLISLGAVDFGIIIETAIFAAEALVAHRGSGSDNRENENSSAKILSAVLSPAFLCALLLFIAFIPILSLQRIEGKIFKPLGITLVTALLAGQLGALIFIPIASTFLKKGEPHRSLLDSIFEKILNRAHKFGLALTKIRWLNWIVGLALTAIIVVLGLTTGKEFLPQLNEGALFVRASAPPTISREASVELAARIRQKLLEIPEVKDVLSQLGRPDDGTDINGFDNIEFTIRLEAPENWKSASTLEGLTQVASEKLKTISGVDLSYSQPIKDNVDEAISGVKSELVVKIFGFRLETLQKLANQATEILKKIPGAEDVSAEELMAQPELRFEINRDAIDRYGLRVTDAEDVLETALLGKSAGKMTDDQGRSIDIVVMPRLPDNPTQQILMSLPVLSPDGARIPLGDITRSKLVEGVGRVYREQGERRIAVKSSVRGRAVVDFVKEANEHLLKELPLPEKYRLQWAGSFENAARAGSQLAFLVPLCFLAIVVVLFSWFKNWVLVGLILWELPFSLVGGILAIRLAGLNLSISAAAGAIVLMGVSLLTGMILISAFQSTRSPWKALHQKGKSILISSGVAIIGLIPAAFSHGIGAETARPFAIIILGGLISSLVLTLFLLPNFIERSSA